METKDLIVIGGGINGAGIAADAAGRGLSVLLLEAQDLACATSSASSKLIHGGLRYLEHYEFRLVSEALAEREVLLKLAPHIAFPMRFRLPHQPHLRPAWMIRIGLFLYDHLGKRTSLPGSKGLRFGPESVLKPELKRGFEYSDCWVDDARLVVLNAQEVEKRGGEVRTRTKVTRAWRENGLWMVEAVDIDSGKTFTWRAKGLVNATGPWVKNFFDDGLKLKSPYGIRLIKGSHIVVPRVHDQPQSYILQNEDHRIVFVIPWNDEFSIIGTTDVEYKGDPKDVKIDENEIAYLLKVYNDHFKKQLGRDDIVWTYSGVRPLCDDESDSPQAITRDYTLDVHDEQGKAPLLSVFGGKLTTYRKLAEHAMEKLAHYYPGCGPAWTKNATLPGGDIDGDRDGYAAKLRRAHGWLPEALARRYARTYGSQCIAMLAKCSLARGDLDNANTHLQRCEALLHGAHYHRDWLTNTDKSRVIHWQMTGDTAAAAQWLRHTEKPGMADNHFTQGQWRNIARVQILLGQYEEAGVVLDELNENARRLRLVSDLNRNLLLSNQLYWLQERKGEAQQALIEALSLANRTGFISHFVIEGEAMAQQLRQLIQLNTLPELEQHRAQRILRDINQHHRHKFAHFDENFVDKLLTHPQVPELIRTSPLTQREWQVLGLIYSGYSNDQIAGELDVAATTIKTHIRNLYQKLGVAHRQEAVQQAQQLLKMMGYGA